MIVYYGVVISVLFFGMLAQYVNSKSKLTQTSLSEGEVKYKNNYGIFYFILFAVFVFVGGFRYYVGTDFGGYYKMYVFSWTEIVEAFKTLDEPGLKLLSYLARLIWNDGISVIFFSNLITTLLVFRGISKFDNNDITIMLLIYIFFAGWTFSFNGVRQALAASVIFAFVKVGEKSWILKYTVLCFIAFLFHKSALMMLPILILSRRKFDKQQVIVLLFSAFIIPLFFDFAFSFMGTDSTNEEALLYIDKQINPIRVVVSFAPIILLFFVQDKKDYFGKNSFAVNLIIYNAILTFTTMNSAYLNRFTYYTKMFLIIYFPSVLKSMRKDYRIAATIAIVVLYFLYFRYELTNGVGNVIWQWSFSHFGEH